MLTLFILHEGGRVTRDYSQEALQAALRDPTCTFWLDMLKPTDEEIALLDDVFGFHPLAIEDTINYAQRPKVESYNHVGDACTTGYFYMVFHGPDLETFRESLRTKELDLFLSSRYLVTIHDEVMKSVATVLNRTASDPRGMLSRGTDLLLHNILDYMVDHYEPILDYLDEALDELEERALGDPKPAVLGEIASKKKELLNLRRIVGPQREVVAQLTRGEVPFIRESTRIYLRDVQDHLIRVVEMIELYRDLVLGSRDIYLSSISNNLNQIMKVLTIITVTALPLTVVTSFYGQNFQTPEFQWLLQHRASFWLSMGAMVALIVGLLMLFRWRKWM
ncbi:MAG: Magnesium and cobalt transport protein CorA [uncultured Phycisphaerae bacterium]|uniref:Magnesium transport protein CorA n=1 Tax=uncultured Phycisphaerae bacterium TaxID=904963 RepID=A0A6J4Q801_9BACT|nr:MAG: Magnesium and cobalt transport protein CorA [uncultured Phycisphaerae bacterium]